MNKTSMPGDEALLKVKKEEPTMTLTLPASAWRMIEQCIDIASPKLSDAGNRKAKELLKYLDVKLNDRR